MFVRIANRLSSRRRAPGSCSPVRVLCILVRASPHVERIKGRFGLGLERDLLLGPAVVGLAGGGAHDGVDEAEGLRELVASDVGRRLGAQRLLVGRGAVTQLHQIGRASWRERGCTYG